jgi:indole-3-glycerol phosphate synthase
VGESYEHLVGLRRLSQAISEGDGISVLVDPADVAAARAAEEQGAEGLVLRTPLGGVRDATTLPVLWRGGGAPRGALAAGADAWCLVVSEASDDEGVLEALHAESTELGLECVVEVREEDELELALERIDPEIFLLAVGEGNDDHDPLDHVLSLLPDVPAGKLAIADVPVMDRDEVLALERAGIDGVIVAATDVRDLVGDGSPEV